VGSSEVSFVGDVPLEDVKILVSGNDKLSNIYSEYDHFIRVSLAYGEDDYTRGTYRMLMEIKLILPQMLL